MATGSNGGRTYARVSAVAAVSAAMVPGYSAMFRPRHIASPSDSVKRNRSFHQAHADHSRELAGVGQHNPYKRMKPERDSRRRRRRISAELHETATRNGAPRHKDGNRLGLRARLKATPGAF